MKYYIGIDNGVSGSIGITSSDPDFTPEFHKTPVFKVQDYTKTKKNISRVDYFDLHDMLCMCSKCNIDSINAIALVERPMINPGRFKASISAARALEVTLLVLEDLDIPYQFLDSKQWQKEMLPKGVKGSTELKKASKDIGERLFPQFKGMKGVKDFDGILISEWAKRNNL
jgi:hypothetical protein